MQTLLDQGTTTMAINDYRGAVVGEFNGKPMRSSNSFKK
jgi:hypothetical protein